MTKLNKDFRETIEHRKTETYTRLDELNQRITDLDKKFEEEKIAILKEVDERGQELTRLLNQFKVSYCILFHYFTVLSIILLNTTQAEFDEDRKLRLQREEIIVKQLTDHEQEVADKFEKQIVCYLDYLFISPYDTIFYIYLSHFITFIGIKRITI